MKPGSAYIRTIRYWNRLARTFLNRFKRIIIFGILVGIAFFFILPKIEPLNSRFTAKEKIGVIGRYSTDEIPIFIQEEISLGLTIVDETGEVHPGLSSSWDVADEGKAWTFKLTDSKWQDGKKIAAQDINYNFADVETEIVDEQTIRFRLKDPFSPFPVVVSRPLFKKGLLGAGDWRVEKISVVSGNLLEEIRLESISSGKKKIYRFYPGESTAKTALKLGEISTITDVVNQGELKNWKNIEVTENIRHDRYVAVFFNLNDGLLTSKDLRQALSYAIDKEALSANRAIGPVPPSSWAFNPQVKPYDFNQERAKQLLGDLPEELRQDITINLVTTPTLLSVAERIEVYWEQIGIKTNVQVSNSPPADFQALLAIQATPADPDQYSLWHSTQGVSNITNYGEQEEGSKPKESPRIDKLLEDGRRVLDKNERKRIYLDFQRFLVEDAPAAFLYYPTAYTISRK